MKYLIANWKMEKTFHEACAFAQQNATQLQNMCTQQRQLVLCPSFPALFPVAQALQHTSCAIGAQNVSRHVSGAYTGQVSPQSLYEVGCRYCIIGHSETRQFQNENSIDVQNKCTQLLKQNITPIICIGESLHAHKNNETFNRLSQQLEPVLEAIVTFNHEVPHFLIAYEPIWAIGSGTTPEVNVLEHTFSWLFKKCRSYTQTPFSLLYGGSVKPTNIHDIMAVQHIDGVLVGGASLQIDSLTALADAL